MYRIAICDDEDVFIKSMGEVVRTFFRESGKAVKVTEYPDGNQLKKDILAGELFHIVILDIEMPDISGMELASVIKSRCQDAVLIFVTAHERYAVSAYELSVFRYVLKSRMEEMLTRALAAAIQNLDIEEKFYIIEKADCVRRILQRDILYIYRSEKNAVIVTRDERIKVRKPLKDVYEVLHEPQFFFADRGYIVNIGQIRSSRRNALLMKNQDEVPISVSHIQKAREMVKQYWNRRMER